MHFPSLKSGLRESLLVNEQSFRMVLAGAFSRHLDSAKSSWSFDFLSLQHGMWHCDTACYHILMAPHMATFSNGISIIPIDEISKGLVLSNIAFTD